MSNLDKQVNRKRRPPIQLYVPPAQRKHAGSKFDSTSTEKLRSKVGSNIKIEPASLLEATKSSAKSGTFQIEDILQFLVKGIFLDWNYAVTNRSLPLFYPECKTFKYQTFKYFFPFNTVQLFSRQRLKYTLSVLNLKNYQIFEWYKTPQKFEDSVTNNISLYSILKQSIFIFNNADIETCMFGCNSSLTISNLCQYKTFNCKLFDDLFMCTRLNILPDSYFYPDDFIEQYFLVLLDKHIFGVNLWKHLDYIEGDNFDWNVLKIILENRIEYTSETGINNDLNIFKTRHKEEISTFCHTLDIESKDVNNSSSGAKTEIKYTKTEQDQEKHIMKKTKQSINRKTRHIIKYIDEETDVLMIENTNVSNWEDLFDNDPLQETILKSNKHKQASSAKAENFEDVSYASYKGNEELEHVVELYDFPSSFATHDIISAFHEIHNDSMYVKWINDTQALLILGSSSQAQKALGLSHPMIKVRSMSEASKSALAKANQSDIKPAMKRPETNLNTARRLITSHLGAKSRISKEQAAQEKESLRKAKETKRMLKQNEKDAWEGNLRSTLK